MQLGDSIRRSGKDQVVIKSIIWNTIIEIFKGEKGIDVKNYLVSIRLMGDAILVKTNKPLINSELLLLSEKIKKASAEKLQRLGLRLKDFEIKYK
ncbi:MAG: hypothetical protein PHH06_00195 [Candidatus Gracilibacteria bacterium]|nr:hypothetical protein [Candidatus Gracilibacteria bacterium]